jgi:hypothetical protein
VTDTEFAVRRVSDREIDLKITGYFMPTQAPGVPVLAGMPGIDDLFIMVFATEEKLRAAMADFAISYARIAKVTSGTELLEDIDRLNHEGRPYRIRLAVDPHKAANGRVRFIEALDSIETPEELS